MHKFYQSILYLLLIYSLDTFELRMDACGTQLETLPFENASPVTITFGDLFSS